MALPSYTTGTVSVSAGGTIVTGIGTIWSGTNAQPGDEIYINNTLPAIKIKDITDTLHLTLWAPWTGANQVSVPYIIVQDYPSRVVGVAAAVNVGNMLAALSSLGPPFNVPSTEPVPDPSYDSDGLYAEHPPTGKHWVKNGAWRVFLAIRSTVNPALPSPSHPP